MAYYDIMQVCLNGHRITDSYNTSPENRQEYCDQCGAKTITTCPICNKPIRGHHYVPGVASMLTTPVPEFCFNCGKAYPWIKSGKKKKSNIDKTQDDSLEKIKLLCQKFHSVAKQIQVRHDNRPSLEINDEYDVQDLLHGLLRIFFNDIRPEEYTPNYAGGSARMDFLLKEHSIVIEVKKTRKNLRDKDIGNQLIEDIARYREHKDCKTLVCFIYDPEEYISNPHGLIIDLSQESDGLSVLVIINPSNH